jgi:hypothetical protein
MRLSSLVAISAFTVAVAGLPAPMTAQTPAAPVSLGVLALEGEWAGEAWMIRGPEGRQTYSQREWVELGAGGTVIKVRGRGTEKRADGTEQVIHDAFAVIHRNHEHTGLMMRAFTAHGQWLDMQIASQEGGYIWTMTDPRMGMVKYDMVFDARQNWIEKGFLSRDGGKTWMQFMEMTLARVR